MASQVCIRCRKRRIRCDMQLPACAHCRRADVECMIWDATLDQEIPCSRIFALQQRAQSLQLEIEQFPSQEVARVTAVTYETNSTTLSKDEYHQSLEDPAQPYPFFRTTYLGPGNSAGLIKRLLTTAINWHVSNNVQIPNPFLQHNSSAENSINEPKQAPQFYVASEIRKTELHAILPPSTQRAIIEHYSKVVKPEYNLLPDHYEGVLLAHENPLKWANSNKDDPVATGLSIIFATATALIARDLDYNLISTYLRCREDVQKLCTRETTEEDLLNATMWKCLALCTLAICELVCPTSNNLWDVLGRATSTMEDVHEHRQAKRPSVNIGFQRLERVLLKLESLATLHFKRPSLSLDLRLGLYLQSIPPRDLYSNEHCLVRCLHTISQAFNTVSVPNEALLESLIPLSLQVTSADSEINIYSATVYIALHPLFTDANGYGTGNSLDICSPRTIQIVAKSASIIIDNLTRLNESNMIISLWLAAERVLEAGSVWVAYLIYQRRLSGVRQKGLFNTEIRDTLDPVMKVSALLASFTARWKAGSACAEAWKALVELLWAML